jgi:outer membrane protein assembly factor BamB
MYKKRLHPGLALVLILILFGSVLTVGFLKTGNPAHAVTPSDWTTYQYTPGRSGFNSAETAINPNTASSLIHQWTISEGSIIATQPVVVNGKIYWGSWDGIEHATNVNGSQAWTANLGTVTSSTCQTTQGIVSAATVANVTINGTPTSVLFVGGGNTQFYALNANTGAVLWHTPIGVAPNNVIWSSPVLYNGSVYISTSSLCDQPLTPGQIFRLDAVTGTIQNTFTDVPNGCVGAGVWGSITIDSSNGTLYFATGNGGGCSQSETMADAVVQLNASTLALMSSWQIPPTLQKGDLDFGSTPTLFPATIGGTVHHLFGVPSKNGNYYAFDEAHIAQGPVWTDALALGGPGPESGDGSISPGAWDGTNLYVGGGRTTIGAQSCQGGLRALDPATGAFRWQQCMTDGPIIGAVTAVPGVVAVTEGTALWLMATSDGHSLFKAWDSSNGSKYYASPTISNGVVYAANKNGQLSAYGLGTPPSPTPDPSTTSTPPTPSPTPTPPPEVTGPVSKVWYFAEGRAGAGFKEFLTLGNPTNTACQVKIEYLYAQDRGTSQIKTVSVNVPAARRVTEWVDGDLGTSPTGIGITDSAIMTVDNNTTPNCNGIVAERPMYFNALGVNSGSDELGVTHTNTTFYFADVATGPQVGGGSYASFLPILNPGAASATVTATYYASGQKVGSQQVVVPAGTRGTIFPSTANPSLPPHTSVVLTSTQPVVSERPTYFSQINGGNAGTVSGGADVIGVQSPATDWLFAEGYTNLGYDEWLTIQNPTANPETITVSMVNAVGTVYTFAVPLVAHSRYTVDMVAMVIQHLYHAGDGYNGYEISLAVQSSSGPFVVERPMYWNASGTQGGSDIIGYTGG